LAKGKFYLLPKLLPVYTISHDVFLGGWGWGGGGDETFPKFAESFTESFAKILEKFHELKTSKKTQH